MYVIHQPSSPKAPDSLFLSPRDPAACLGSLSCGCINSSGLLTLARRASERRSTTCVDLQSGTVNRRLEDALPRLRVGLVKTREVIDWGLQSRNVCKSLRAPALKMTAIANPETWESFDDYAVLRMRTK